MAKFAKKEANAAEIAKVKAAHADKQKTLSSQAGWAMIGGGAASLWLLTNDALVAQCTQYGLEVGTREEMIQRLTPKVGGVKALGDVNGPDEVELNRLSKDQMREVCVGQGIDPKASKKAMMKALVTRNDALMIGDEPKAKKRKTLRKAK